MIFDLLGGVIRSSVAKLRPRERALAEADAVHVVQQVDRVPPAEDFVAVGDHAGQVAGRSGDVVEGHAFGQHRR